MEASRPRPAGVALQTWQRLGLTRHPARGLLDRVWELRGTLPGYDATYAALEELLQRSLLTTDKRERGERTDPSLRGQPAKERERRLFSGIGAGEQERLGRTLDRLIENLIEADSGGT